MFQRELNTGGFPETIWDVSKTPPLDPSNVDPIWDGSPTFSVRYAASQSSSRTNTGPHGSTSRSSSQIEMTSKMSGTIRGDADNLYQTGKVRDSRKTGSVYANFPLNMFATTQSEERPIMANDELAKRSTVAVTPSRDMVRSHSTFKANSRRSDMAFASYKDNPMTVL